jgi:hypothetical protein
MKALKVKIFTYFSMNIAPPGELQMNDWLRENPDIEILHVAQSESMAAVREGQVERSLSVTVLYRQPES